MLLIAGERELASWVAVLMPGSLVKGVGGHKYIRRVPTGKDRPKYRYYYADDARSKPTSTPDKGAVYRVARDGSEAMVEVVSVGNGSVSVRNRSTGETAKMSTEAFEKLIGDQKPTKPKPEQPSGRLKKPSKYVRRTPKPGGGWRYFYAESSAARGPSSGETVRAGDRVLQIESVDADGSVSFSEGGKSRKVSAGEWVDLMVDLHGSQFLRWRRDRAEKVVGAVFRKVPRKMLEDLKGSNDRERMQDLEERAPDVYRLLKASFDRYGIDPFTAGSVLKDTLARRGWEPEARAMLVGSILRPDGAKRAGRFRSISRSAERLARGEKVTAGHVDQAIGAHEVAKADAGRTVSKKAASEIKKLASLLEEAAKDPGGDKAAELMEAMSKSEDLARLITFARAMPGTVDKTAEDGRKLSLQVPSVMSSKPKSDGAATDLWVPGEGGQPMAIKATYKLMEADDLIASHDPVSFRPRQDYPSGVQERAYHRDDAEQGKVIRNAQRLNPSFVVNTNPDAINGPPVMLPSGVVLGGNSRTMSMQRAYRDDGDKAKSLRSYLAENAAQMGFSEDDVKAMQNPVLVRVIDPADKSRENQKLLVRQLNESFTQAMDPRTMQVAAGRKLSDKSLASLADAMREDETLGAFLGSSRAEQFVEGLFTNGLIDERNANQYTRKGSKKLNEDGKRFVEGLLVGRMVGDADLLSDSRPSVISSVARVAPLMIQAEAYGSGYSLRGELKTAMSAYAELDRLADRGSIKSMLTAKSSDREFEDVMEQLRGMPGIQDDHPILADEKSKDLLKVMIRQGGPNQMTKIFRAYAKGAAQNPEGQTSMFGAGVSPSEVFRRAVAGDSGQETPKPPDSSMSLF